MKRIGAREMLEGLFRVVRKAGFLSLPFILSAVMLTVIQEPFGADWLAWVAVVPFILVCSPKQELAPLLAVSYAVGAIYWLGNLYYLGPVTQWGWAAFSLYTALLWPALVLAIRYCRKRHVPLFIAAAVLFVGAERLQGLLLGGFFWRMLGHSQYQRTEIIQIADIFGAEGVSFLVAIVNGAIADVVIAGVRKKLVRLWPTVAVVAAVGGILGTVAYGRWRIRQSEEMISMGPVAASVQSDIPQSVKESENAENGADIMSDLLKESREAGKAGAELTAWPETMVQASLDRRILRVCSDANHPYRVFDEVLQNHARQTGYLLVGAYGGRPEITEKGEIVYAATYNSAFLYQPDGHQAFEQYNKIHLVPFGEVVPFRKSWPWLYRQLMRFTPYDHEYSLDYGTDYTVFEMFTNREGNEQRYKFGVLICYEGTIPNIARRLVKPVNGKKGVDFLVNISNDGWFVGFEDGKPHPSAELVQHAVVTAFRAVENRVSVVRSVNTGISCLIDPLGRIHNGFLAGSLPEKALERKGMAGWFVDNIPVDKRVALFTVLGPWLGICSVAGFAAALAAPLAERFFRKKKT